jgi:hypothetical protein
VALPDALAAGKTGKCPVIVAKLDRLSRDVAFIAGLMALVARIFLAPALYNSQTVIAATTASSAAVALSSLPKSSVHASSATLPEFFSRHRSYLAEPQRLHRRLPNLGTSPRIGDPQAGHSLRQRVVAPLFVLVLSATFVAADLGTSLRGPSVSEAQQKKRQGVFGRLFAPRDQPPAEETNPRASSRRSLSPNKRGIGQASGSRTLCVRTCDGYYFPISFSTSRNRFKIDEAVCKAMYGGAAAELYVHNNASPADRAVSLNGKPMMASTNAFAHRHFFSESCQGQLKRGLANLGEVFLKRIAEAQSQAPPEVRARAPTPVYAPVNRVARGQDPETLANLAGRFTVAPVISSKRAVLAAASVPMRKLGPGYYYISPIVIKTLRDPPPRGLEFTLIGSAEARPRADSASREKPVE